VALIIEILSRKVDSSLVLLVLRIFSS